jgi:CRP/FNR family cyclic AMP-dependent transcriptional regulator
MKKEEAHRLLSERGWLANQPQAFQQCVLESSVIRTYHDGEIIYGIGDPARGLHALVEGLAKLSYDTQDGEELLLKIFKPGDWLGMISLADKLPLPHNAWVCGTATVLTLPHGDYERIVNENPLYLKNFSLIMTDNMRDAMERLVDLGTLSPAQRLAKLLLRVPGQRAADAQSSEEPTVDISQSEMSALITASRATVNKLVKDWSEKGWIEYRYRKLRILDPVPLRMLLNG